MQRNYALLLLLFLMTTILVSCGQNNSSILPPERSVNTISGNVVDSQVINGTINIYEYSQGKTGKLLDTTTTDDKGYYEMDLDLSSQPILLELTGGNYVEEASGKTINLGEGQKLLAVFNYKSGQPLSVMVTPYTTLEAGLIEYKVANGESAEDAINQTSDTFSSILGFDPLSTYPRNITDQANASTSITNEYVYGFDLAAISSWTAWASEQNGTPIHDTWNSIGLVQLMYNDIRADGLLDGKGVDGSGAATTFAVGSIPLNSDVYRQGFAEHILIMANSDNNKTGLTVQEVLPYAKQLASNDNAIYGGASGIPLDQEGPVISASEPEGQYHNKQFTFSVNVQDLSGVGSVSFDIDGVTLGDAKDLSKPSILIDTTVYPDGKKLIGVKAVDLFGNESYRQFSIIFNNSGPFVNFTSPDITNQSLFTMTGTYDDQGVGLSSITVQGKPAAILANGSWSIQVTLTNGVNNITVVITDKLSNKREIVKSVSLDQVKPAIEVKYSQARYSLGEGRYYTDTLGNASSGTPLYFTADRLGLNGASLSPGALQPLNIPFIELKVSDANANDVFTPGNQIKVKMRYHAGAINGDLIPAPLESDVQTGDSYIIPIATEYLHPDWYKVPSSETHTIEVTAEDNAGNITPFTFTFKANFYVREDALTADAPTFPPNPITATAFTDRASLLGKEFDSVQYAVTNTTDQSMLFQILDASNHTVTNLVEQAVREHLYRMYTTPEWRVRFLPSANICDANYQALISAWTPATILKDWDSVSWVYRTLDVAPKAKQATSINSDTLPTPPVSSNWVDQLPFDNIRRVYAPFIDVDYGRADTTVSYYAYVSVGLGGCVSSNNPGLSYTFDGVQSRENYTYTSEPGYPQNNYSTFSEVNNFVTKGFQVTDAQNAAIAANSGWYRLSAHQKATIRKSIILPVIPLYNDTDVGTPATFNSYILHKLDKTLTWNVQDALTLNLAIDTGTTPNGADIATRKVDLGASAAHNYVLTR